MPQSLLESIFSLPENQRMTALVTIVGGVVETQSRIERKVDWVLYSFVGLIISLLIVAVTIRFTPHATTPKAKNSPAVAVVSKR